MFGADIHYQVQYPTLARIARDLAIQGSSVASGQAFSSGGHTDDKSHNQLSTDVFEELHILKHCYRDGLIKVEEEASTHKPNPFVYDSD